MGSNLSRKNSSNRHHRNSGSRGRVGGSDGAHRRNNSTTAPFMFNAVHGENIQISHGGTLAKRTSSFCKGIAFSDKPVAINEKVFIKIIEVSTNWSGVLRFGFTTHCPQNLRGVVQKCRFVCPDLTNKAGFWAKAFNDTFVREGAVICYYVNQFGDVIFGVNGEEKGVFFTGVDIIKELWCLFDIYGNTTAVEFVDANAYFRRQDTGPSRLVVSTVSPRRSEISCYYAGITTSTISFHSTTNGKNIATDSSGRCGWRTAYGLAAIDKNGYLFTSRPIFPDETIVIQFQGNAEPSGLSFGVTSCNPCTIARGMLPDDSLNLLDRPEYWVVVPDAVTRAIDKDEFSFSVALSGAVSVSRNGTASSVIMYVDTTVPLWAFFDLRGQHKVCFLGSVLPLSLTDQDVNNIRMGQQKRGRQPRGITNFTSAAFSNNGTISASTQVVSTAPSAPAEQAQVSTGRTSDNLNGTVIVAHDRNLNEVVSAAGHTLICIQGDSMLVDDSTTVHSESSTTEAENRNPVIECMMCCERAVDSVFYTCGHMCMCFECATDYWKTKGKRVCPVCRASIVDVIRTYKS